MCNLLSRHPVIILSAEKHFCQTPTRQTGRGWTGERHLTLLSAFLPPFIHPEFCFMGGMGVGFISLSFSWCFAGRPE